MPSKIILQNQKLLLTTIGMRKVCKLPAVFQQLGKGMNTQKLMLICSSVVINFLLLQKQLIEVNQISYLYQLICLILICFYSVNFHFKQKNNLFLFIFLSLMAQTMFLFHLFYNQIQIIMSQILSNNPQPLTVKNYKRIVQRLIQPHKELIDSAAEHFKNKMAEYRSASIPRTSNTQVVPLVVGQRSPSLFSQISAELEHQEIREDKTIPQSSQGKNYQLQQWESSIKPAFPNYTNLAKYYQELFHARKCLRKNTRDFYDFKVDEKRMLTNIFHQIRTEQNAIQFQAVITFFDQCKLFYLCYNIKPNNLLDLLKDSAHQYSNKLTLLQFLNVFFIDRPNLVTLHDNESIKIAKRCILQEQSWKELKLIFSTLDTFGNETISMAPFLFKIKNNHANRQLINEPTIQYPEINRTLPMKKIIFNLENRYKFSEKISWPQIQKIIKDFRYQAEPTIDIIYKRLIQRGKITKFSNYFMISNVIIEEIKHIFNRCPKYCEYFIKTKFFCNELLQSTKIKLAMKEAIVRIVQNGNREIPTTLQKQIRLISKDAEDYIDLDELLQYFTIKGPINTKADVEIQFSETDSQEEQQRIEKIRRVKSAERLHLLKKSGKYPKPVRHLTLCEEFKLSSQKQETIMERRTRQWKEEKQKQVQMECRKKIKANPIPAQLNPERYRQYIKQQEQAKQIRHEQFLKKREQQTQIYQYLKTNTNLFTAKQRPKTQPKEQYKFTPKSIPWHIVDTNLLKTINQQKTLRKKKILTQNKLKILRLWKKLPDVMQNYEQLTENENDSLQNDPEQTKNRQSLQADKDILKKNKVKEVPDFKKLHLQFQEQLNKKKQRFAPTVPISPNFTQLKKREAQFQTNKVSRIKSADHYSHIQASAQHKTSVQTCIAKQYIQIPTTKKYLGMIDFTQEKLQQRQLERIKLKEVQIQRRNKQYNFAKFMQKKLKQSLHKTASVTELTKAKVHKLKGDWKQLKKQNQEQMYQMYSRVMARPFLFENNITTQVTVHAQKVTKSQLSKTVVKPVWKKSGEAKHIHQSPLKYIAPEQESPKKEQEKHQIEYELQSESEQSRNKAYLMNQSF